MHTASRLIGAWLLGCLWVLLSPIEGLSAQVDAQPAGKYMLADPRRVLLSGPIGGDVDGALARLGKDPYTTPWLLADISFGVKRIFTNYSGDVSGRFVELGALTGSRDRPTPATLTAVLGEISKYQKAVGHFGVEVDQSQPLVKNSSPKAWRGSPSVSGCSSAVVLIEGSAGLDGPTTCRAALAGHG